MEASIAEVVRLTGTTSRTLRHYDAIGLRAPSRVGSNGVRYYDQRALTRLQRILLLRRFGMGLTAIRAAVDGGQSDIDALRRHMGQLHLQRHQLDTLIGSVERSIAALQEGETLMAEEMFEGFDNSIYREEVEQRWGSEAYSRSDRWWRGLGERGQRAFQAESQALAEQWQQAHRSGLEPGSTQVRDLARRHIDWVAVAWGGVTPSREQVVGLGDMYVADERFAANYGGPEGAAFVRDALVAYAESHLP